MASNKSTSPKNAKPFINGTPWRLFNGMSESTKTLLTWFKVFVRRISFLRAIGFKLPFVLGWDRHKEEQPKDVFQISRRIAIARCGIHVPPVVVSATIICLNLFPSYLGRTLPGSIADPDLNIALLQMAAKVQELLVVASVTTIVICMLRHELVFGKGVPLGMLAGGFTYSSINYFWSPDFLGSLGAKTSRVTRLRLCTILVVGGILAAGAGPSTAILLIPSEQPWNAGGTSIFLPTSAESWWPTVINSSGISGIKPSSIQALLEHGLSQTGGYLPLRNSKDKFDIFGTSTYTPSTSSNMSINLNFGPKSVDIANNFRMLPAMRYGGNFRGYACETAIVGPRAGEAVYQQQIMHDWATTATSLSGSLRYKYYKFYSSLTATTKSRIPVVRILCSSAQNISRFEQNVEFPVLNSAGCSSAAQNSTLKYIANLENSAINHWRITWIDNLADLGAVSVGLAVESPWDQGGNSRAIIACSIDARWANGNIITSDLRSNAASSNLDANFKAPVRLGPVIKGPPTAIGTSSYSEFRPVIQNAASMRIILDPNWLYDSNIFANDSGTVSNAWTPSNLEKFLGEMSFINGLPDRHTRVDTWNEQTPGTVNRTVALEWALAMIVVDSLSRAGSEWMVDVTDALPYFSVSEYEKAFDFQDQLLQGRNALKRPASNETTIEERVDITIGGFSYQAKAPTDYLAIVVLSVHIVLAISHSIHQIYSARSSSAWDSLTELLVLMQLSTPATDELRNTGAGIKTMETYGKIIKVDSTSTNVKISSRSCMNKAGVIISKPPN